MKFEPMLQPQVEVAQIEMNDFFVKVFCEHKAGGFVRLMEARSSELVPCMSFWLCSFIFV